MSIAEEIWLFTIIVSTLQVLNCGWDANFAKYIYNEVLSEKIDYTDIIVIVVLPLNKKVIGSAMQHMC